MSDLPQLHSSLVAMVSLAAGIASNHPAMGQCQMAQLRQYGVPEHQIGAVIEIARHIRDEASMKLDVAFDAAAGTQQLATAEPTADDACGCTPTATGQACC